MLPAPRLDDLTRRIRERSGPGDPASARGPYILFLGEGCAKAAGAPSREEIAREALKAFKHDSAAGSENKSGKELFDEFSARTASLSPSQFARMLRSLYANVPVPSFYQDLAQLVRERYFPLIMTMNFDTLLEQALAGAGVRSSEYRVTTFGTRRAPTETGSGSGFPGSAPLTHLVKLHGDLAQDIAHVTPQEIESALGESRSWIKADLVGDLIMVAHVMGDDPIDRWLAHAPQRELWWVNADAPPDMGKIRTWTNALDEISGDIGRPQIFFSQLAHRLLRAPEAALEAPEPVLEAVPAPPPPPRRRTRGAPPPQETPPPGTPPPASMADALQREILRGQSVLYKLEQDRVPGQEDPRLQAQIQYQKQQISRLEGNFLRLPSVKPRALELVNTIATRVRSAASGNPPLTSTGVADFIQRQADTLGQELRRPQPDQVIISALLGATLAVADRLHTEYGDAAVRSEDVKQLAALVPTVAGKVVL